MFREEVLFVINNFCIVTLTCSVLLDIILIKELHQRTRKVTVGVRVELSTDSNFDRVCKCVAVTALKNHCCQKSKC